MEYILIGVAGSIYLSYAIYSWSIGRRERAIYYLETFLNMILLYIFIKILFVLSLSLIHSIFRGSISLYRIPTSETLSRIPLYFDILHKDAVSWITYVAMTRAVISLTPFVSSLNQIIGSATEWAIYELNIVATTTMVLTIFSRIFIETMDYILFFGNLLTPIPQLRKIGATFLSIYLVLSILLFTLGDIALTTHSKIRNNNLSPPSTSFEYLMKSLNVFEWKDIIDKTAKISWILLAFVVKATFVSIIAGIVLVGISLALGGIYTWIQPF